MKIPLDFLRTNLNKNSSERIQQQSSPSPSVSASSFALALRHGASCSPLTGNTGTTLLLLQCSPRLLVAPWPPSCWLELQGGDHEPPLHRWVAPSLSSATVTGRAVELGRRDPAAPCELEQRAAALSGGVQESGERQTGKAAGTR